MNTPHTVFQNRHWAKASRRLVALLIAAALASIYADPTLVRTNYATVETGVDVNTMTAPMLDLIKLLESFNLPNGTEKSLTAKLQSALTAIKASDTATTCVQLSSFISECQAQSGKKLTADQANQLINSVTEIKTELGCLQEFKFNLKERLQ